MCCHLCSPGPCLCPPAFVYALPSLPLLYTRPPAADVAAAAAAIATLCTSCPAVTSTLICAPYCLCSWCCCCCCSYSHRDVSPATVPTLRTCALPHLPLMRLLQLQLQLHGCFSCCCHCCWMHTHPLTAAVVAGCTHALLLLLLPLHTCMSSHWPLVHVCPPCTGLSSVCSLPVKP